MHGSGISKLSALTNAYIDISYLSTNRSIGLLIGICVDPYANNLLSQKKDHVGISLRVFRVSSRKVIIYVVVELQRTILS